MDTSRLPFTRVLKQLGFYRVDNQRDPLIYKKIYRKRKLEIQLWKDGHHRVSHWISTPYSRFGRMCTLPTDFQTLEEMHVAIQHEKVREDHPPPLELGSGTLVLVPE